MLRKAETIRGYALAAHDGEIGKISDLYFDDETWTVRYMVVQTGNWPKDRRVLVSPRRIGSVDADRQVIETDLTLAQVKDSPPVESERTVSECMDVLFYPYHFWPPAYDLDGCEEEADIHLRSMEEVEGYTVAATDGDIGHLAALIVDDTDWVIRYAVVDPRNLWPGKHVLMSLEWMEEVDWRRHGVRVNLARSVIKESPEYDNESPVTREYESDLCRFYRREGYWSREPCPDEDRPAAGGVT